MRLRLLRLPAFVLMLGLLDAAFDTPQPAEAASSCSPSDCLKNSAVNNRVQPTSVTTDDKGDSNFFASATTELSNLLFVLDNSTSMYELPFDNNPYPNSAWVNSGSGGNGRTPNGCAQMTNSGTAPVCGTVAFASTAASCANNSFFSGLVDASKNAYNKNTSYPPPDPFYDGSNGTSAFFTGNKVYKFFEWATAANVAAATPGGVANGGPITFDGTTVTGTTNNDCNAYSNTLGTGGRGGGSGGIPAWSMTQRQRCQQCLDEVGYYLNPGPAGTASSTDNNSGNILFKGNWLNFYPPKYLIARKALTDFITAQKPPNPAPLRVGVVSYDTANLNSTDVPDVSTGFTGRNDGGAFVSAGMIPDCGVSSWSDTAASGLVTSVRKLSFGDTDNPVATPLAEAVFNAGQFLSGSDAYYTTAFTSGPSNIWLKDGFTAPTGGNRPICVACQLSAIVLITDGEPNGDNNLPQTLRNNTIQCPKNAPGDPDPCGVDQSNNSANLLDDVTNFLANADLSPDAQGGLPGTQSVITYVIGVGLNVPLLDNAAKYGKTGGAMRADNAQQLQQDISGARANIASRATSFSASSVQTLQVGSGSTAFVPQFIPGLPSDPIWEGHLFRFDIFNEFVAGTDLDHNGDQNGVFLVDKDVDIIQQDANGAFVKVKNGQPAVPIWDAAKELQQTFPGSRRIYTALWDASSGTWNTITLPDWDGFGSTPPNFDAVGNALGIDGTPACSLVQAALATPIDPSYLNSSGVFDRNHCILAILDYVRGFNSRNELKNTTSLSANRLRMLGDIFHSSPVMVDPPVDQFFCDLGLHPQCVSTLYQYDPTRLVPRLANTTPSAQYTVSDGSIGAYEKYWRDHEGRKRVVLVGANDGMIHAFDAGSPTSTPPTLDPSLTFRQVLYDKGTGSEVWSFIPPDQLPRLWLMEAGHQIYLDGDIMVRDVWVDGVPNDKGGAGFVNQPLVKQDVEFHTVAVAGERQGGSHHFALDVTDTNTPKLLWVYPPPCSDQEAAWGQTWSQVSPRPPPIGPVLLETTNSAGQANYGVAHTEERYGVFLNGGHSPYQNRGRAVALLDAFTGVPLFLASYQPSADDADPAKAMRFGFAASAALVDYGTQNSYEPDGFFDSAVMGDEGGQVWAFRMGLPGHIDSGTGLVNNWTFGRAYEQDPNNTNDPRSHQPIFNLASTAVQPDTGWLRAFVGTGDRAHIRSQTGGDCRPDDPMTCITAGCAVSTSVTMDNATTRYTSTFSSAAGSSQSSPAISAPTQAIGSVPANACNASAVTESVQVSSCPASGMSFSETLNWSCSGGGTQSCTEGTFAQPTPDKTRNYTTTPPVGGNTFVGVAVLANGTLTRAMNSAGDGVAYDQGRVKLSDLVDVTSTTANSSGQVTSVSAPAASRTAPGWALKYATIDEKTVSSATVAGGCVLWSSLLPSGGGSCAAGGTNVAATYQSDPFTGAPTCAAGFIQGALYARKINVNVGGPPSDSGATIAVGAGGSSVRLSVLGVSQGGLTNTQISTSTELLQMIQSLPLTAEQHVCRHVDPTTCK
jgi:type IV pilus assembly protein PilY1